MPAPVTPRLAVDAIIALADRPGRPIVLIERRYPPPGYALPGGFVDVGETLEMAAVREAREETCLDIRLISLLGCYSNPARDARGHTVSAVYIAEAYGDPAAADDARAILICDPEDRRLTLAFDHRLILDDYLDYLRTGQAAPLR